MEGMRVEPPVVMIVILIDVIPTEVVVQIQSHLPVLIHGHLHAAEYQERIDIG
jgi:hypothetical protein